MMKSVLDGHSEKLPKSLKVNIEQFTENCYRGVEDVAQSIVSEARLHALEPDLSSGHASDRTMWNWQRTDLCSERCRCGFVEIMKSGETVAILRPGGTLLFKDCLPIEIKKSIVEMLTDCSEDCFT